MILAIFDLQVTPMLPFKFPVNWPFCSGEEAKNRFSRWGPFWISDRNDFSYFWSTSHPDASYQVSSQLAQGCRRSRLLKPLLMPHDAQRTLTDFKSVINRRVNHNTLPLLAGCKRDCNRGFALEQPVWKLLGDLNQVNSQETKVKQSKQFPLSQYDHKARQDIIQQ